MAAAKRRRIRVVLDKVSSVRGAIESLTETRLLIGIPADKTERNQAGPIGNAALLYIHEHGAPEANIPAREVMGPVLKENKQLIAEELQKAAVASFEGRDGDIATLFGRLGQTLADMCRLRIQGHIPPPLSEKTVLRRTTRLTKYKNASKQKRAQMREAATSPGAVADAVPLFDTGQMARAITWVIRKVPFRLRRS